MNKKSVVIIGLLFSAIGGWAAASVTVNQTPGAGDFTTIQAAINSGASVIIITDSGRYVENIEIGDPNLPGGSAVTLTSTKLGDQRPVITPSEYKEYTTARRTGQRAGFGLFANGSKISNLVIEANPDLGSGVGAMVVVANNVLIENCVFRIASGTSGTLSPTASPLLFFAQAGDGTGNPTPGAPDCNGCIVRNCEFIGIAPDADPVEPTGLGVDEWGIPDGSQGYWGYKPKGTGQGAGHVRVDVYTVGSDINITIEGCYFHHIADYGIFPTNLGSGAGDLKISIKKCRFDATAKFHVRARGANVDVEDSIFTRCGQSRNGDSENSAVSMNNNDGHQPTVNVRNCLFVNCGSANWQRSYFGGLNNHNSPNPLTAENCTFVSCLNGVSTGTGGTAPLVVKKSIFHQIGANTPPAVDVNGIMLKPDNTNLVDGLYLACTNGLTNFVTPNNTKWSGVFNAFTPNESQITIDTCLVGTVALEDSRPWEDALVSTEGYNELGVIGCRLYCGYDWQFVGTDTVTRGIPVFVNTDPDAPNAFQLAPNSPGQGLGANLAPVFSPKLLVSRSGSEVTVSWAQPIWIKDYVLKKTSSLINPDWSEVTGVAKDGVNNSVKVAAEAGSQFFAILKK